MGCHLWLQEPSRKNGDCALSAVFEGDSRIQFEFKVPEDAQAHISNRMDHFLLAALFPAMREGGRLQVHGPVSRSLIVNASEFCAVWRTWRPSKYKPVEIESEERPDRPTRPDKWIQAFSGGIDACTTLYRNTQKLIGPRSREIGACLMVHGLDIPEHDTCAFEVAHRSAKAITDSVGVPLNTIKTNLKVVGSNWEDEFALIIAACLSVFNGGFGGGLISGDNTYATPSLPWGSNPVSNHFLGSEHFPIHTDASEMTRLEKVGLLRDWPEALKNIRVCWEGPVTGENCGRCEKCVRTQLEFLVQGMDPSSCFAHSLTKGEVSRIVARNKPQLELFEDMARVCRTNSIHDWWAKELNTIVKRGVVGKPSPIRRLRAKLKLGSKWRAFKARR